MDHQEIKAEVVALSAKRCNHDRVLVVWSETMDLEEVWCGVCEQDVTEELQDEVVEGMLKENIAAMQQRGRGVPPVMCR